VYATSEMLIELDGRHNDEILAELGYPPEQIADLGAAGAIR